jgi:deoxycytidylate deaminase
MRPDAGGEHTMVARGHNHFPGIRGDDLERVLADRELKYPRVVHAEVACLTFAARRGVPTEGLTMACPWAACLRCVGPILDAGIARLVVHRQRLECPYTAWNDEIVQAHEWLASSGVELIAYDGDIPHAPAIRVNHREWQP